MTSYNFLLSIAIILVFTKIFGYFSNKVNMPNVVGALVAGIVIGPSCLGLVNESEFLSMASEIGVILLMFTAGMETDTNELRRNSVACIVIAMIGVIVPLIGGAACYYFYFEPGSTSYTDILKAVFVGVVLTATSVSITVEALREMGKLEGKVGSSILGAAVIDDIIGIIVLTIVMSLKDTSVSLFEVFLKIGLFGVFILILAYCLTSLKGRIDMQAKKQRASTYSIAACFFIAYITETVFGVADITGAYLLGLFLSQHDIKGEVTKNAGKLSTFFFSPVFFASVGLKVVLSGITLDLVIFSVILLIVAVLTKIVGCGLGARACKYTWDESIKVGVGMISRGEVALIVAQKGFSIGLIDSSMFPPIIIVVIATTIITPIMLKKLFKA